MLMPGRGAGPSVGDGPDSALNVNETATFRVKITNTGPLNLTDVTLRIKGLNGATVANNGAAAPFESELVTQPIPSIAAHGGSETTVGSPLKFKAPGSAQESLNLVRATLEDWNANTNHIFDGHSDPLDTVRANFATEVVPAWTPGPTPTALLTSCSGVR